MDYKLINWMCLDLHNARLSNINGNSKKNHMYSKEIG